jgi:glutamate-ammonia-ligase adenylyltransferase
VQIFSLLRANPNLLTLITDLTGSAPRLARQLSARVDLLDAMLTPDFFEPLPDADALGHEFASRLVDARDLEECSTSAAAGRTAASSRRASRSSWA